MRPGGVGMRRITDRLVTDLPEPDSPTTARVSPRSRWKLTPSTALTVPSAVSKYVLRSTTSSSLSLLAIYAYTPRRETAQALAASAARKSLLERAGVTAHATSKIAS